jgi:uncharacterized Tic20 family protein
MKFAFVGLRQGKRRVNFAFVLLVGVLSAAIATGLSFLIAAVLPESTITTTLTNLLPLVLPVFIVMPPLLRGLTVSADQLPNLDD